MALSVDQQAQSAVRMAGELGFIEGAGRDGGDRGSSKGVSCFPRIDCCYYPSYRSGGRGKDDGTACLVSCALATAAAAAGAGIVATVYATNSAYGAVKQAARTSSSYNNLSYSGYQVHDEKVDQVRRLNGIMLKERAVSSVGQLSLAAGLILFSIAAVYYAHIVGTRPQGMPIEFCNFSMPTIYARYGTICTLAGGVVWGVSASYYDIVHKEELEALVKQLRDGATL